jgi:hypothetical protein
MPAIKNPRSVGNPGESMASRKPSELPTSNHVFASGENTHYSGIYKSEHPTSTQHEDEQEIFIPKGTKLPSCPHCSSPLQYRLIRQMNSISEDPDFQ